MFLTSSTLSNSPFDRRTDFSLRVESTLISIYSPCMSQNDPEEEQNHVTSPFNDPEMVPHSTQKKS
jgi:hypothetical protein